MSSTYQFLYSSGFIDKNDRKLLNDKKCVDIWILISYTFRSIRHDTLTHLITALQGFLLSSLY